MSKEEFLRELEEALAGDVPEAVIRDNVSYYGSYLSQEMAKGRSVEEIVGEIGEPFIIAKTIIEHCEASGECAGDGGYGNYQESYDDGGNRSQSGNQNPFSNMHYIDLNKWYWKLLAGILIFMVVSFVFRLIGGMFALLIRFSGPLLMFFLVYWIIKNFKK
ncbi:MAG: DUF1700 domain-containing protein [Lachnospiraceae bacterium]|nr:DUF1700 domain-containing protein [Lachnospiraceae bacterium]